jgi:hypothetical protein
MGRLREGRLESQQYHRHTRSAPRLGTLAIEGCNAQAGLERDSKVQRVASSHSERGLVGEPSCNPVMPIGDRKHMERLRRDPGEG